MTHDIEVYTVDAEEQYNTLCRFAERGILANLTDPKARAYQRVIQAMLNEFDLYLWTQEKADRCLQHIREHGICLGEIPFDAFPAISADPGGVVVLSSCNLDYDRGLLVADFVMAHKYSAKIEGDVSHFFFTGSGKMLYDLTRTTKTAWKGETEGFVSAIFSFNPATKEFTHLPGHDELPVRKDAMTHVGTAIEQMWYAYRPRTVVVKTETKETRRAKQRGSVPGAVRRAHQKEVHIVLDPDEIKVVKQIAVNKGTHASPIPHKRRAHKRVLKAARFKNARGKVIDIGEVHVNCEPGERIELPKKIYHVVSVGRIP